MSEQFERLASCERITEWLNPWDRRLINVTGLRPPVDGKSLREDWHVEKAELPQLVKTIKRLLVPHELEDQVNTSFGANCSDSIGIIGTVSLEFEHEQNWSKCFPLSEKTLVFDRHGVRGDAAIALCGQVAGLAVISMDFYEDGGLDFAVQSVRVDKLTQIVAS